MPADILHADLDAFYASVEQRDVPRLRGRAVIVGAGVVLSSSYEARACGVRTAMGGREARALCPHAVIVPPRFGAYVEASRAVFEVFHRTSPLVEALSIDEAFLHVGGLRRIAGPPVDIALRLRQQVRSEVGLPITVGVARTKFLAKVASGVAKPDGLLVVEPEEELGFLHPLPVERLWGVGPKTAARLRDRGVVSVGQVAALPEGVLAAMLGPSVGRHVHALAHNRDPRPVAPGRARRSVGAQRALGWGRREGGDLDRTLIILVERVTSRMRRAGRTGRTVTLHLRFADLGRAARSTTLPQATAHTPTILAAARRLLAAAGPLVDERGITLVGVAVGGLDRTGVEQLALPLAASDTRQLDAAVDRVRERFGAGAVTRLVLLGRSAEPWAPLVDE